MENSQVRRDKRHEVTKFWDPVRLEYPVRLTPATGVSSTTSAHALRANPQVLTQERRDTAVRGCSENVIPGHQNAVVTGELARSRATVDFGYKPPTVTERFCQATPSSNNLYLHGGNKRLEAYPIKLDSHGVSEMRSAYRPPVTSAEFTIDMAQHKHPYTVQRPDSPPELQHDVSPIDISSDSYIKYLDPYVSTSHMEHRPFTSEHLSRKSNTRDIITYYTFADVPRVRGPRPNTGEWWRPEAARVKRPMSDREKFKFCFRENRVHNQLAWTPTAFKTETAVSFVPPNSRPESRVRSEEDYVKEYFNRNAASLRPDDAEKAAICNSYTTESRDMNSGRPLTASVDQDSSRCEFDKVPTKIPVSHPPYVELRQYP